MGQLDNIAREMCQMAADTLDLALERHGVSVPGVDVTPDGTIHLWLHDVRDAEALLTLAVDRQSTARDLYSRITGGCVTLEENDTELSDEDAVKLVETSWFWDIHPVMFGRRVDWHVSVILPMTDAFEIARALNTLGHELVPDEQ